MDSDDYKSFASWLDEGNGMVFIEICILVGELLGLILTSIETGWRQFYFYTQLSNYFLAVMTAIHLVTVLRKKPVSERVNRYLYTAICLTTVTFSVVAFVLLPMEGGFYGYMLGGNAIFHHTICPILGAVLATLIRPVRKKDAVLALVPTLIYSLIMFVVNLCIPDFGPYPFFKIYNQPVYMSLVWLFCLLAIVYGVAQLVRLLSGKRYRPMYEGQ